MVAEAFAHAFGIGSVPEGGEPPDEAGDRERLIMDCVEDIALWY